MRTLGYISLPTGKTEQCENLVLMCMDFRFHRRVCETLWFAGYRDFDLLAIPGASRAITDETSRQTALRSITTAVEVHSVKRLFIVDHIDCRAYGGSAAFTSEQDETEAHRKALQDAAGIVRSQSQNLEIIPVYVSSDRIVVLDLE